MAEAYEDKEPELGSPEAEQPLGAAAPQGDSEGAASAPDEELAPSEETDPVLAQIMADLEAVTRERDEFLETAQRLQAEFDNYRRRVARQQAEAGQAAVASFVAKLLPALDTLNLALAHASAQGGSAETASALAQVHAVFHDVLTKEGLEVIEPVGKRFDPTEAEAVAHEAGEGEPTVSEVLRLGYRWRGQVIRPAMVKVTGS
jgi:molecular chaperone GrpE